MLESLLCVSVEYRMYHSECARRPSGQLLALQLAPVSWRCVHQGFYKKSVSLLVVRLEVEEGSDSSFKFLFSRELSLDYRVVLESRQRLRASRSNHLNSSPILANWILGTLVSSLVEDHT